MKPPLFYKKTRLPNGVVVATENMAGASSVSLGVWLDIGSRDETTRSNGVSHLFEHMVFKGTGTRTGFEIVRTLEASGGQINAFTTKEQTCFYVKVVESELPLAVDILLDMVLDPVFDEGELNKEREVVIEELKGCEDNPDDRVYDLFGSALFGKHSLGYPIAGTVETVKDLNRRHLLQHLAKVKSSLPVYVIAAGKVSHSRMVSLVRRLTAKYLSGPLARKPLARPSRPQKPRQLEERKPIQQANVILGGPAFAISDPKSFSLSAVNCVLGDGMSSRLFQILREEYGYVYNISTYTESLVNAGIFGVSFSTEPGLLSKCLGLINREFSRLIREGLSRKELEFAVENLQGTFLLDMESAQNRMTFLARSVMYSKRAFSREDYLKRIQTIRLKSVNEVIRSVFRSGQWGVAAVMPKALRYNSSRYLNF